MKFFDEPWLEIAKLDLNDIVATSGDQDYDNVDDTTDDNEPAVG